MHREHLWWWETLTGIPLGQSCRNLTVEWLLFTPIWHTGNGSFHWEFCFTEFMGSFGHMEMYQLCSCRCVCVVKGEYLCPPVSPSALGQLHTESRYNNLNNLQHSNRAHVSHFTTCYCTTTGKPRWYSPFAIDNIHFFAIGIKNTTRA